MSRRQSILIYRIGQLGDTLIAMPAIQRIREKYPRHRMVLLTNGQESGSVSSWEVLSSTGWIDEAIFYRPQSGIVGKAGTAVRLLKQLRSLRPEYIFNLAPERTVLQRTRDEFFFRGLVRTGNYIQRKGAARTGYDNAGGWLHRVGPEWEQLLMMVDQAPARAFRLAVPDDEKRAALAVMSAEGMSPGKIVAIGPGSKMPSKVWPEDRYAALGRALLDEFPGIELVVLGGREDSIAGDRLCGQWGPRSCNMAGKLTIYGSAAVLEHCIAYIGNDTGTMHLGAMVGVPCVVLFSARDRPGKWEPYGEKHRIIRKDTECAGCMLEACSRNNDCLRRISVEEVLEEAKGLIRS